MVSIMSKNVKNIFDEKKILNHELEIIIIILKII
jgi:hypothetical protein